jgi:ethanolamine utilization protein EutS
MDDFMTDQTKPLERIIQESVPGKQVSLAHVIAKPMADIYRFLNLEDEGALGILTLTPSETAIIAADIATKAANVTIGFLDRTTGSVVIGGDVQSVETSIQAVTSTLKEKLGFAVVAVTMS